MKHFLNVHFKNFSKNKVKYCLNFLTVREKKSKHKIRYFQIIKGGHAENSARSKQLSQLGVKGLI
jgi:hypothetical protein